MFDNKERVIAIDLLTALDGPLNFLLMLLVGWTLEMSPIEGKIV